ncbi:MAG: heavy metal-binding domain-containing protein [Brevinematia bacterium]
MKRDMFFMFVCVLTLFLYSCGYQEDMKFSRPLDNEIGKEGICVVDGMKFTITEDTVVYERDGKRYYFCGMGGELDEFRKDPDKYTTEYDKKYRSDHSGHEYKSDENIQSYAKKKNRKIAYYRGCSLYPDYVSEVPGKCPAGMDLIPVYEDEVRNIVVDGKITSLLGFKIVPVFKTNINVYIRLPGRVVIDSELYNLQSEYISVTKIIRDDITLSPIKEKLYVLGYDKGDLAKLEELGKPEDYLVVPNEYVSVIVYVNSDIKRFIRKGMEVYIDLPNGAKLKGVVRFVSRVSDSGTLLVPVRVKVYDPYLMLNQNMYVNANIVLRVYGIVVDKKAVIYTGKRKTVYVYEGNNVYVARDVEGEYIGDFFIVRSGVSEGDMIVVNGNSLLDAQAELIGIFRFGVAR